MMKHSVEFAALIALLLLPSVGFSKGAAPAITVTDAYARKVPPSAENSAAYFTLANSSDAEISLTDASGSIARAVEIHEHVHVNGMMKMERRQSAVIHAHGKTEFRPMGYHVMLIGLKPEFFRAKTFPLKLTFSNGQNEEIQVPIR